MRSRPGFQSVLLSCFLGLSVASPVGAQEPQSTPLAIGTDSSDAVISGSLRGDEVVDYQFDAEAGQRAVIDLRTNNLANYFNLVAPGADEATFIGSTSGTRYDGVLAADGEYRVRVYLMPSAARRNETADYTLSVVLGPTQDYADGLLGGPDFWQVVNVRTSLNLRIAPSTAYGVIGALANGEVVRNLGCRMTGGERWCEVERLADSNRGWAAGRYLREAAAPPRPAAPRDSGVVGNGRPFSATGSLPCATLLGQPTGSCPFGVIREGRPGFAGLWIAIGDGVERYFLFEDGNVAYANTEGTVQTERSGDLYLLRIGDERYEIPEAVVYGG